MIDLHRRFWFDVFGSMLLLICLSIGILLPRITTDNTLASTSHFKAPRVLISKYHYNSPLKRFQSTRYLIHYTLHSARYMKLCYVNQNYPIWTIPKTIGSRIVSTTDGLANNHQPVEIDKSATDHYGHRYYYIVSDGYHYGWVPEEAIHFNRDAYKLPFHYYSQLYPLYAPDACEAVALRMALSVKGHDPHMSMREFIRLIPRSHNPDLGYTANPFHLGDHASIYPPALAKYGRKYDRHVYDITGSSEKQIISDIEHGNPVVFEGSWLMHDTTSDHTLVLMGYLPHDGYFEFADPYHERNAHEDPISLVSVSKFKHIFTASRRNLRAVLVK